MRISRYLCAAGVAGVLVIAAPAAAQQPTISFRGFLLASGQQFAATETFDTIFGQSVQPFWGGGIELIDPGGFYVDLTFSRLKETGQRAFFFEGEGFRLNTPLTVTIMPIEFTAGYRFGSTRVVPYAGGGIGTYKYEETSDFDTEPFEKRHVGYLAVGGLDFRISSWFGVSADVQYTHVPGIIGSGGVSLDTAEDNLGGIAARFRMLFGR